MTTSVATGLPVAEIPVQGFARHGEEEKTQRFRNETTDELLEFMRLNGYNPGYCGREHPTENRGSCTRPKGHVLRGENGMHLAGASEYICGAW